MSKRKLSFVLAVFMVFALLLSACGGGAEATPTEAEAMETEPMETEAMETEPMETEPMEGEEIGGTVSVLAVWAGDELDNFRAMVAPFEEQTGITVEYEGTRDINAVLTTRLEGGNPPDLAGLPGPGQMQQYIAAGHLVPLDDVLDMEQMQAQYDQGWLDLATVDGQLYAIFIKGAVKSLVWYSPPAFEAAGYEIPETWDEMMALSQQIADDGTTPWCLGLQSGAGSDGWPGTDWIEDIMLRTAPTETYDQWVNHETSWTDPAIENAWQLWGEIVTNPDMVYGGTQGVLSINFGESPFPMFEDPPGCYMHRQASFITGFITEQFPDLVAGEDYNFFPFPQIDSEFGNTLLTAGDLFGMFNDTPQSRALMQYLVTAEAQAIWAERGGFLSANKTVDPSVYPDELAQQFAEMLATADAVRFDASDLMPGPVSSAFLSGILEYVSNPDDLPVILEEIDATAADAYE